LGEAIATMLDLEDDVSVVGVAESDEAILKLVAAKQPDITLMDVELEGCDGIELTSEIVDRDPTARVVVLSTHVDRQTVRRALAAGAVGFGPKNASRSALIAGLRAVAAGWGYLHPSVTRSVLAEFRRDPKEEGGPESLTEQQRHVLAELAKGKSMKEIGEALFISDETVKTHLRHIYKKLGVNDRVKAVAIAFRSGLVV